jgi:hypothetical protein
VIKCKQIQFSHAPARGQALSLLSKSYATRKQRDYSGHENTFHIPFRSQFEKLGTLGAIQPYNFNPALGPRTALKRGQVSRKDQRETRAKQLSLKGTQIWKSDMGIRRSCTKFGVQNIGAPAAVLHRRQHGRLKQIC